MHEILRCLPPTARVLDLGSFTGSFEAHTYPFLTVRLDLARPSPPIRSFVQANAGALPFREAAFDAVIANHSLEHFEDLGRALSEIGRVCKPGGALYTSVPDSTTVTDRLYRWLARGGGHVNAFDSPESLISRIQRKTGMPHVGTRLLCTSLSFLNSRNRKQPAPRKLLLLGNGSEAVLVLLTWVFRRLDRFLGTRCSLYGWAFFFGQISEPINPGPWVNVCVRCGAGHPSDWLSACGAVKRSSWIPLYRCPSCTSLNPFFKDEDFSTLH